ncbi:DUF4302 domain-containing protein [Sphingobacterium sp.]|uniref:DUF4302 domain-containing protein n=1 Tax=Sphingobacterium sp. TaxID=341027 RepID=UPI0028A83F49|nr:DUF4302 domain-containing protein [Sphingobacterium sp.]
MKPLIFSMIICLLLISCKKEFEGVRPDAKLNQLKDEYAKQLTSSKNGWIGYLYPKGGGSYTFKFTFDDKNRVKSYATIDNIKAGTSDESSYRLAADQVVSLYFDTYSYIHQLSDPDEQKSGGLRGGGLISDFEFSIIETSTDTIKLVGNHNESDLILIRAKENEGDDYIKKAFILNEKVDEINQLSHYYKTLKINNKDYGVIFNPESKNIAFYYEENSNFKSFKTEYAVNDKGIYLKDPFNAGGFAVKGFENFIIDKTNNKASAQLNGSVNIDITNQDKPISIDKDAPRRMYLINKRYSSAFGFTIAGKKDALGIRSFPSFNFLLYIPRMYIDPFDALFIIFLDEYNLGPVFTTLYNNQGILSFKVFRDMAGQSFGPEFEEIVKNQNQIWFDPQGFYVFETGDEQFDFVSVKDSRVWIRFK